MSTPTKPTFKMPDKPPMKPPADTVEQAPKPVAEAPMPPPPEGWQPISTAPEDPDARFLVRATVPAKDGKGMVPVPVPVPGTETLVRYRMSRKMVGGKWKASPTIIDDKLGTKLGFRPTEWISFAVIFRSAGFRA